MYLITGSTGFVGKQLVIKLYRRKNPIYLLLHERDRNFYEQFAERFDKQVKHVVPLYGDVTQPNLGLDKKTVEDLKKNVKFFYHLAEINDHQNETQDKGQIEQYNVQGTVNAVNLANQIDCTFHYLSTLAVGENYKRVFTEKMLVEGQDFETAYSESKYQAEIIVKRQSLVPYTIYRPGTIIGSSETGEAASVDGPYHIFKLIQQLRDTLPKWMPLLGIKGGRLYLVPVNYVADAIDYISHEKGVEGKTFHLCRNQSNNVGDVINEFCRVAHAPRFKVQMENILSDYYSKLPLPKVGKIPVLGLVKQQLMEMLGLPESFLDFANKRTRFDNSATRKVLAGSGIECPHINLYSRKIWNYWEYHMAPLLSNNQRAFEVARTLKDTPSVLTDGKKLTQVVKERWQLATSEGRDNMARVLKGKTVLLTGGSSGIGRSMAHRLARANGTVILVARSVDNLNLVKREVEELGGGRSYLLLQFKRT